MCLAVPGCIESMSTGDPVLRTGRVNFGGIIKEVSLACVPNAIVGDYVLVHAGLAITRIDEEAAKLTLDYLSRIDELKEVETSA